MRPPATLALMSKARAMTQAGIDVISFGLGEPDFDTPAAIREAAIAAMNAGQTHYMPPLGDPQTRALIAEKLTRENGLAGLTGEHVAICAGARHALYMVFQCLLDGCPGQAGNPAADEVLLPVPAWVSYAPLAQLCGGRVVELPTRAATGFKITPAQLRAAITPRARILVLNSPSNPCGTMYTAQELEALAAVVADAADTLAPHLVIVTDEIYEKIVYGEVAHFSIGSVPAVAGRTVTVNGLSKAYAMTGWRVGYAAAPGEFGHRLIAAIEALQGQMTSCITSFVYAAARAALTRCQDDVRRMCARFAQRARMVHERLARIPDLPCLRPTGAFYAFPDVSAYFGKTTPRGRTIACGRDFAEALLAEHALVVVPGEEFGGEGHRHVRLSFACAEEQIERGMERLARFVQSLR